MNARGLAYKLARRCVAASLEVAEGPVRSTSSAAEGAWEFTVYSAPMGDPVRKLMGVVVVYADLDVRVVGDNATAERELRAVLKSM